MSDLDLVSRVNADYVEEQYQRYRADPSSVDERWALFFAGFEMGTNGNGHVANAASAATNGHAEPARHLVHPTIGRGPDAEPVAGVFDIIHSYRELGHLVAHLNPLADEPGSHPLLEPS